MTEVRRRDAVSAAGGGSVGVLLVWILQELGVDLRPAGAASLAATITAGAIAIGHRGIVGIAKRIWRGDDANGKNGDAKS